MQHRIKRLHLCGSSRIASAAKAVPFRKTEYFNKLLEQITQGCVEDPKGPIQRFWLRQNDGGG
jgi:hypothetical protein